METARSEDRSHDQRWADAAETFQRFVPDVEPQRVADSFDRRLGPLGTFAFEVVGDMWNRPQLSRRDRSLFIISTLAAQARADELVVHTEIGLRHGLTRIEIEEILPLVAAYAGFPAAMAASRHVDAGLRNVEGVERLSTRTGASPKSDDQRDSDAAEVRAGLLGRERWDPVDDLAELKGSLGDLGELTYRWAFGEIWSRSELSRRDRSIVVLSILTNVGVPAALAMHVEGGLHHGLQREEIEELFNHLGLYAGIPRAIAAMSVARDVFERTAT